MAEAKGKMQKSKGNCFPAFLLMAIACLVLSSFFPEKIFTQNTFPVLKYPWAGGLNSCTFGSIDLNLDGQPDLVIFERFGNRVIPFIQSGTSGNVDYSYHPEYASFFPNLSEWVEFVDYNCDGKQDIFTYYAGGIRVFKNVSDTILRFKLITNLLQSYYYTGYVGILGTPVDFPAFADLDNDGDIDVLTFFGLGSFVEFHRNLSMEKYGTCDSLDYILRDNCWGDFKESEGGNKITLDALCPEKKLAGPLASDFTENEKHTGSTMLAIDLKGNGVKDLLLGDVDFPNIISLINGGTKDSAHMVSLDSLYPGTSQPIKLFSFPSCSYLDMDHDGLKDLVISPFDPAFLVSENFRSVWFYQNTGTATAPFFQFREDGFFQHEMIDVGTNAYPVLFDINGDGLSDLFIGNFGYYDSSYYKDGYLRSVYTSRVAYYRNNGTETAPAFKLVSDDFAGLSQLHLTGLYPSFGDLDGDGDADLILGNADGSLIFLENTAGPGLPPVFKSPVFNYQNIDVKNASAPQLFDLDRDGLPDLTVGKQDGTLSYYHNSGTSTQPLFTRVTDTLGNINVTNPSLSYYGYSTPCFFLDNHHRFNLLVGSEEGKVYYYTNIDNNLAGEFLPSDSLFQLVTGKPFAIRSGSRVSPAISFLSDPEYMDLVVGNFAGGLNFFSKHADPAVTTGIADVPGAVYNLFRIYPNPADKSVFVKSPGPTRDSFFLLEMYNSMGLPVAKQIFPAGSQPEIFTGNLPEGLYLIVISPQGDYSLDNRFIAKVIVRH